MTTPARFDGDAQHRAAGTLPRAIDLNAIDDCTVDGSSDRNVSPVTSPPSRCPFANAAMPSPTIGKTTNVVAATSAWSRQCVIPAQIAPGERRAP